MGENSVQLRRRPSGFTLIETMVVIALLAIVAGIAAPGFSFMIGSMNSKAAAFDLINDLTLARSEAIKRNQSITILSVGGNWRNGWQLFVDADGDGVLDAGEELLREHAQLSSALSVSNVNNLASLSFLPNGRLPDNLFSADGRPQGWSISSSYSGVTPRCIVISPTGSARSKTGGCS